MLKTFCYLFKILCVLIFFNLTSQSFATYLVGAGQSDITGPVAEVGMMGYAKPNQIDHGLHMRLRSRAFIFTDENKKNRVVFVSADLGHIFNSVKQGVIKKLQQQYGNLYNDKNVMLSATHTHSGPGGYSHEILFNITTLGFVKENYNAIVEGIVLSIKRAHNTIQPADILINDGELTTTSKNRSIEAYNNNPAAERSNYNYPFDTKMTLLRIQNNENEIGMLNWFPLHGVSMSNLNLLISPDNKGYASYLFEKQKNILFNSEENFVAAFAQANEGDVSPNINSELNKHFNNDFIRNKEAAYKQFHKAYELYQSATNKIEGPIEYRHTYIDMSNIVINNSEDNEEKRTCKAAIGYSFAAGTEDGAGANLFHEGTIKENPFLNAVTGLVAIPSEQLKLCQSPKPILLAVGLVKPTPWVSQIQPIQMFRLGQLVIVGVPGEFTTMSGRRLKTAIKNAFSNKVTDIVIAGLANSYSGYITTPEEYQTQQYEGGFTLFGQYTLNAYIQEATRLAMSLNEKKLSLAQEPIPEDFSANQISFQPESIFDDVPPGKKFGENYEKHNINYKAGETVNLSFWGAHPKNNLKLNNSFFVIEKKTEQNWIKVADDNAPNTFFQWERVGLNYSKVTITWEIPQETAAGIYRIRYFGTYKYGWNQKLYDFEGLSNELEIRL